MIRITASHKNSTSHIVLKTSPATIAKAMHQMSCLELHRAIDTMHHAQAHACMTRTLILTLIRFSFPAHRRTPFQLGHQVAEHQKTIRTHENQDQGY
jgi:hypothetical protein